MRYTRTVVRPDYIDFVVVIFGVCTIVSWGFPDHQPFGHTYIRASTCGSPVICCDCFFMKSRMKCIFSEDNQMRWLKKSAIFHSSLCRLFMSKTYYYLMAGFKVCRGNYLCYMHILMCSGDLDLGVMCVAAVCMRVVVD